MHRIALFWLIILVTSDAFGGVRLPVVNVASGAVSARTAFGEPTNPPVSGAPSLAVAPVAKTRIATTPKTNISTRAVTTRGAARATATPVDRGEKIASVADVLIPQRPSADLWATSDTPLRIPNPSEFLVMRSDYDLPEESLDTAGFGGDTAHESMSTFNDGINRLAELQQRADASVVAEYPSQIVSNNIVTRRAGENGQENAPIKLSRMVVPMDSPDVVVRSVNKNTSPTIAAVRDDMTKMSPSELRRAFRKTFLSENKHLSTFAVDDRFDEASDMSRGFEGFTAVRDLSESDGIRPLEIKIRFRNADSALSRDNYTLLTEYASIVVSNPKRAIQVAIPESVTTNADDRKLAARRLAIIEQVLRDTGVAEQRIMPVLSARNDDDFVLRIISGDQFETMTQQQRNMFGDSINKKTYKSMSW